VLSYSRGDFARAIAYYERSLGLQREQGNLWGIAAALNNLGNVWSFQGDFGRAAALLLGAAAAIRTRYGNPSWQTDRLLHRATIDAIRATRISLGEDTFATAWAAGAALPLERAVAAALDPREDGERAS
jgi:hypothetical protein